MVELAINGGKPIRDNYIVYGRQWIDDADIEAVTAILKGDFLTTGPAVDQFEKKLAEIVGAKYVVAFANGTAALHCACFAAGIGPGDEVITSPLTFAASANCVLYMGGEPVFADVDPDSYNISVEAIEEKINSKTKAIIPVDLTGRPCEIEAIMALADKHNLVVIQDSAHALGARIAGKTVGSIAHMTEFSFHPVKHITTGEGGAIATDNKEYYEKLKLFRTHGITRDEEVLIKNEGPWYYEQHELGFNYRITDLQCALGLSQLDKLDHFVERRKEIAEQYRTGFLNSELLVTPMRNDTRVVSSWHLYVIRLNLELLTVGRREIFEALRAENIGVNVHYIPVYYHPYYKKLGYKKGLCPASEAIYDGIISLPMFPKMSDEDIDSVISGVLKVLEYYRK